MPAYVVGDVRVTDPAKFDTYVTPALASLAQYGGKVLAAGGPLDVFDGGPRPERVVIVEFPDAEAARRWYHSPEYQAVVGIRLASTAESCVFLLAGV
jgi:uncharacterized protein (DUF1330 family)